jgi:hypothetical protein
MRSTIVATLAVLAASGCTSPTTTEPIDEEPPPSSRQPVKRVADAMKSPTEKGFDVTKPGDLRPGCPPPIHDAWPDGDPKSDPDFAPDLPGDPGEDWIIGPQPTGIVADDSVLP